MTPPVAGATCAGSESVMIATRLGVLTLELGFDPGRPGGPTATALQETVSESISLHQISKH